MTTAITFSRQNDAGSRVRNSQYWESLVLVVVLVSESKALCHAHISNGRSENIPETVPWCNSTEHRPRFTLNLKMTNNIYSLPLFQLMTEPGFVPHA